MTNETDDSRNERGVVNAADDNGQGSRWRGPLAAFLTVVAAISLVLAVTGTWMRTTIMDTDAWVSAIGPLPEDDEFDDLVADEVTSDVLELIDLPSLLGEQLGPIGRALAGPIEATTATYVERATERVIASPAFDEIWVEANRLAHELAVRALRGDTDDLTTIDGKVVLDLVPIIDLVVADVVNNATELFGVNVDLPEFSSDEVESVTESMATALGIELPSDFGQVPVFDEAALVEVQRPVRILDQGVVALWVLVVLSVAGALVASLNRRRTVAVLGVATAVAATLVWLARSPIEQSILGQIRSAAGRQAAGIVIETALWRNLGRLIVLLLIVSLITAAVAFVTGPSRTALSIRRTVAGLFRGDNASQTPVSRFLRRHTAGFRIGGALVALLGMLSIPELTWGWFFVITIVLVAYELSWQFVAPDDPEAGSTDVSPLIGSPPG